MAETTRVYVTCPYCHDSVATDGPVFIHEPTKVKCRKEACGSTFKVEIRVLRVTKGKPVKDREAAAKAAKEAELEREAQRAIQLGCTCPNGAHDKFRHYDSGGAACPMRCAVCERPLTGSTVSLGRGWTLARHSSCESPAWSIACTPLAERKP